MPQSMTILKSDDLLTDLTDPQREAVTHVDGPMLVLAGAGSGKTRVITRRVAHLILSVGISPRNVLAITFTNKAAGEMRDRVGQLLSPNQARAVTVSTFHSLCARILRRYADQINLSPGFSIYDTSDQTRTIKQVLEDLQISTANFQPSTVLGTIGHAKNELMDAKAYAGTAHDYYSRQIAGIYQRYEQALKSHHALDFDDLLLWTVHLQREHPDILAELRHHYRYLLIDEYQDTNHAQFILAHALAGEDRNLCATGDPDQSIYSWRGADIRNILEFETHYPNAKVVRLEQNYRSTKRIIAAADGLIRNNRHRKHKSLWTENEAGDAIRVIASRDERAEAQTVIDRFTKLRETSHLPWSSFAVFYRTNSLSRVVEEAFLQSGVPYQVARGTAFYDRQEIKNAVAYLRIIANPADGISLLRIINTPARGISSQTVKSLQAHAAAQGLSIADACRQADAITGLNTRARTALASFDGTVGAWRRMAGQDAITTTPPTGTAITLRGFVEHVLIESGLELYYRNEKKDPEQQRLANLGELLSAAQQFELECRDELRDDGLDVAGAETTLGDKLTAFLERISLVSDVDAIDPEHGAVTLMTLHAAKGLEFPVVAIVGVEDGLLPHSQSQIEGAQIEEERRLCFVGITRAQRHLTLSHARVRTVFGRVQPTIPSRFLDELPDEAVDRSDDSRSTDFPFDDESSEIGSAQRDEAAGLVAQWPPGTIVYHPQFGSGRVMKITAANTATRAQIDFKDVGVKTLVLQYAKLERRD